MLCATVVIDDNLPYYKQDEILVNIHDIPVTIHCLLYNGLQYVIKLCSVLKHYWDTQSCYDKLVKVTLSRFKYRYLLAQFSLSRIRR